MPDPAKMEAAVHEYVAAFDVGDPDRVAVMYAVDAEVEDPIGTPRHVGREAIRGFYAQSMAPSSASKDRSASWPIMRCSRSR
jgi:steroid Delta-isomerase